MISKTGRSNSAAFGIEKSVGPGKTIRNYSPFTAGQIPQSIQECFSSPAQMLFEPLGAITIRACPRLGSIQVAATLTVVRILYTDQIEILLPIGPLLLQRRRAKACLDPMRRSVLRHSRI